MFETELHSIGDVWRLIAHAFRAAWWDMRRSKGKLLLLLVLFIGIGYATDVVSSVLWVIFFAFLLYDWDNRALGAVAILFLISCPILQALGLINWAEWSAVNAFFFLVMTVVLQLIDLKRHPNH